MEGIVATKQPVAGTIHRTHTKSFFRAFHVNSHFADRVFCSSPKLNIKGNDTEVLILQIMNTNDDFVIAEIVKVSDLEVNKNV